jgi:hypothetical protein
MVATSRFRYSAPPVSGTREAHRAAGRSANELRLPVTIIRKFMKLCDSCGCHDERELVSSLAEERRPRACPLERLLRACGQLQNQLKLPLPLPRSDRTRRQLACCADAPATQGIGPRGQPGKTWRLWHRHGPPMGRLGCFRPTYCYGIRGTAQLR